MTDINKKIIEEATNYCNNIKYVKKLEKYFSDLQRDFKDLTSKLPALLNRELINKDDLLDLEISMDDLAIQIQSAMFKIHQQDLENPARKYEENLNHNETIDNETIVKKLLPLFFTYLMAVDKNSIINKQNFGNTFDSLLQTQSTDVNNNVDNFDNIDNNIDNIFIPFIELD